MSVQVRWLSLGLALMAVIGFGTVASNGVFAQDSTPAAGSSSDATTKTDDANNTDNGRGDMNGGGRDSHRGGNSGRDGMMGKGGPGMPGMGRMRGVDLDALATFLGVTADDITTGLKSGSTLAEIAEANGKTRDELKAFMVQQFEAGLDTIIDASRDSLKQDASDGVGGVDEATPTVDATPAASTGLSA